MFANTTETVKDIYASKKHLIIGVVFMIIFTDGDELHDVSLAFVDVMIGGIVMPFRISFEINNHVRYYGHAWFDLRHSFDVLGSKASILNLCTIPLDRYWAIIFIQIG
ncbi:DOPR2-like protein [Mya arenaria]|uniref:DOPR2-like protein n=1 Tax=Mya arenaria TaxID=6604 RepID=A0ABY7FPK2_MYAAR|nr:DOPR2-like protein [Mya arenaria]